MNLFSVLGSLPASNSPTGEMNGTDWLKVARMGLVISFSYAGIAILEALLRSVTNGEFGIPQELVTPVTGLLSLVLETLRRKAASPPKD